MKQVEQDEGVTARETMEKVEAIGSQRTKLRAQAEVHNYELGQLLERVRAKDWALKHAGLSFGEWVFLHLTDRSGRPLSERGAQKLIEQARVLRPYARLRSYFEQRTLHPPKRPCLLEKDKAPCVTWWSIYHAAVLVDLDRADRHPEQVEDRAMELAHLTVQELRDLQGEKRVELGLVEDRVRPLKLAIPDSVREQWDEARDFVLRLNDLDPEDEHSDAVVVERVCAIILDLKERMQ